MPTIPYDAPLKCLVSVRGHPFDRRALDRLFAGMDGIAGIMVDQPAAAQLLNPDAMAPYDALVLYDMPGLDFSAASPPRFVDPPRELKRGLKALLTAGKGVVALHHALAGWPTWPDYGEWLGGRFLYKPAVVRGARRLDSGYAHDVMQTFRSVGNHQATAGLPASFALTDEPYLCEIYEEDVTPLLVSDVMFTSDRFHSAAAAVAGRPFDKDGWNHPPGSNLAAWAKRAINSPLIYIQPGDLAETFDDPNYRRVVENAIRFVIAESRRRRVSAIGR